MPVVISKELRETLKLKKGDKLQAKDDDKNGLLIYSKTQPWTRSNNGIS